MTVRWMTAEAEMVTIKEVIRSVLAQTTNLHPALNISTVPLLFSCQVSASTQFLWRALNISSFSASTDIDSLSTMSLINHLNNERLHEGPFPSTEYNKLPHINGMKDAAASHPKAHAILLGIIATHGLAEQFSIHLVHRHFDIAEGRVMVYETVKRKSHGDFILCSPRVPHNCHGMRGLYFKAALDGKMIAYEFTTEPGVDLSAHQGFVTQFANAVTELGVQDIFALTALSICPQDKILTELELGNVRSTVLVTDASWLPAQDVEAATSTDWLATNDYAQYADGSVPGIIQIKCSVTRSSSHYNVTCSRTRSGSHLGHAPDPFAGEPPQDQVLTINGEVLPEGSEPHAIVSQALSMVEVA